MIPKNEDDDAFGWILLLVALACIGLMAAGAGVTSCVQCIQRDGQPVQGPFGITCIEDRKAP